MASESMEEIVGCKSDCDCFDVMEPLSLLELLTKDEIVQHINSLVKWAKQEREKNRKKKLPVSKGRMCSLCTLGELTFQDSLNDEEDWVQCHICEQQQHKICVLFNDKRIDKNEVKYTCPVCCIEDIGKRQPKFLSQSPIPDATDLPRTDLSDFIEARLYSELSKDRVKRAELVRKDYKDIEGGTCFKVRVVSSVDKNVYVKKQFQKFQGANYPNEFPYISKTILLFQKIDGVDVCVFGVYAQEFGSECSAPNRRQVYISYLDSVKFIIPEIRTFSGEALSTFLYHELLIAYLEYCKICGFTSCYIWSCAPTKGNNYIFYCRSDDQKTLNPDELKVWYYNMVNKAFAEGIVAIGTDLYDEFFVTDVSSRRLPYFDGDYWPDKAEDIIKRVKPSCSEEKLMEELGKSIGQVKDDFIVLHLQDVGKLKELATPAQICGPSVDTMDVDDSIKSKLFDNRVAFLSFCEDNHYQFNTLRQAKHSSMMILYHLHNPSVLDAQT